MNYESFPVDKDKHMDVSNHKVNFGRPLFFILHEDIPQDYILDVEFKWVIAKCIVKVHVDIIADIVLDIINVCIQRA
jgi:hypothetical protein